LRRFAAESFHAVENDRELCAVDAVRLFLEDALFETLVVCQYIYNLNASALGVATYGVDIEINGQVVASGIFQLK
jgi:hypothetical protein